MSVGVLLDDSVPTGPLYVTNLPYTTNGDPSNFLVAQLVINGALASGDVFYSSNPQNSDSLIFHSQQQPNITTPTLKSSHNFCNLIQFNVNHN